MRLADLSYPRELERYLFPRGFVVTNSAVDLTYRVPYLESWLRHTTGQFTIYRHKHTQCFEYKTDAGSLLLLGHAYNPWSGEAKEEELLRHAAEHLGKGYEQFVDWVGDLSGRFVLLVLAEDTVMAMQDAAGIQSLYYYCNDGNVFFASHAGLIADACALPMSEMIKNLVSSKFYSIGIRHLPGIKSPFDRVSLLTANTLLQVAGKDVQVKRFFPRRECEPVELDDAVEVVAHILSQSIRLLVGKGRMAVSLTGGMDSRMTLAATRGVPLDYFSYVSTRAEEADARFATYLAKELGLNHKVYSIPSELEEPSDKAFARIIHHNTSGVRNPNEVMKSIYMARHWPFGTIEVKSTVSEIGRKFYCKKLGVASMAKVLTPRDMSNLYKRNAFNRKILRYMDESFAEFIDVTGFGKDFFNYEQDDMFYWEHRISAWQSLVLHDSDYSRDTTILFNNRRLQEVILGVDSAYRLQDVLQEKVIQALWPRAWELGIATNTGGSSFKAELRELAERIFFRLNAGPVRPRV